MTNFSVILITCYFLGAVGLGYILMQIALGYL